MAEDVKLNPDGSPQEPKSPTQDVKPSVVSPKPEDVKPPVSPTDVKPDQEPGVKTDPALLLKSLQEERDRRRAAEAERDLFKTQQPPLGVQQQPMGVQQTPQQQLAQVIQEAIDTGDIQKAMNMNTMAAFQWYDSINANLEIQRDAVRGKYSDFAQYEPQAMARVRSLPLNQRMVDGVIEMAYHVEKGKMADKIVEKAKEAQTDEIIKKLQAGESIQGITGGAGQPVQPSGTQPTDEQVKVAEAMGVPIVEYMKNIKK